MVASDPASAAGMQQTRATGVVESIDLKAKMIVLKTDAGAELKLSWFWDTTFLADGKRAKADALKPGTKVEVRYHSPLFGKEYASKIEWQSAMIDAWHSSRPYGGDLSGAQSQRSFARLAFSTCT